MGAWGSGPFENDDAGDWMLELSDGHTTVRETLARAVAVDTPSSSLSTTHACEVKAAMALVAMAFDVELGEEWSAEAGAEIGDLPGLIDSARPHEGLARRCVPRIARSELAELWGDDQEWWTALKRIARAVGTEDEPAAPAPPEPRTPSSWTLVKELGLPQYQGWWYIPRIDGSVVRVPLGTRTWRVEKLSEVVLENAFIAEPFHDYEIRDDGHVVGRPFHDDRPVLYAPHGIGPFEWASANALRALREEVLCGADLDRLLENQESERFCIAPSGVTDVCDFADWKNWKALGADAHRKALLQRLDDLIARTGC